jgi:hypothetical protein
VSTRRRDTTRRGAPVFTGELPARARDLELDSPGFLRFAFGEVEALGKVVWIGGNATPLVTVHLPLVDIGLSGAAAWEDGRPGVLAGASFLLTL